MAPGRATWVGHLSEVSDPMVSALGPSPVADVGHDRARDRRRPHRSRQEPVGDQCQATPALAVAETEEPLDPQPARDAACRPREWVRTGRRRALSPQARSWVAPPPGPAA